MAAQKKAEKFGRNKDKCAKYRGESRRWQNARKRVRKHVKHHENDAAAATHLETLEHMAPSAYVRK